MKGYRKFTLGLVYLLSMSGLAFYHMKHGSTDLTGLGIFATGVAAGVGSVVWGNVQNHRTDAVTPAAPETKT